MTNGDRRLADAVQRRAGVGIRRVRVPRCGRTVPVAAAVLVLTFTATLFADRAGARIAPGARAAACTPKILTVGAFQAIAQQTVVITGTCFGTFHAIHGTDTRFLRISDLTRHFNACSTRDKPLADLLTCNIESWTNRKITFGGFTGDIAAYGVLPGDRIRVQVWNAKSVAGPALCTVRAVPFGQHTASRCSA